LIELEVEVMKRFKQSKLLKQDEGFLRMLNIKKFIRRLSRDKQLYYCDNDLRNYVLARANQESEDPELLGTFTGALLSYLCDAAGVRRSINGEPEKRFKFSIDGQGAKFDYLFKYADNVGDLSLENFTGFRMGYGMALTKNGYLRSLVLNNIKGRSNFVRMGSQGANVGLVVINNCEGNNHFSFLGSKRGRVELLIVQKFNGNNLLDYFGSEGIIGAVIGRNLTTDSSLMGVANSDGAVGLVYAENIKANNIFAQLGSYGHANICFMKNIDCKYPALGGSASSVVSEKQHFDDWDYLTEKYCVNKFLELGLQTTDGSEDEKFLVVDQIINLYEKLKPVFDVSYRNRFNKSPREVMEEKLKLD